MRVRDPAQREALTSPVRLELLEHLGAIGPASVRDLAARMSRSPHSLHYHVRIMEEAGLLRRTGTVKSGPRDEALFDVVANRYEIEQSTGARGTDHAEARAIRAVLRKAEREFTDAVATDPALVHRDGCFAGRLRAQLSAKARKDIAQHLTAIQRIFAEELRRDHPPQTRLETCTLTAVYMQEPPQEKSS